MNRDCKVLGRDYIPCFQLFPVPILEDRTGIVNTRVQREANRDVVSMTYDDPASIIPQDLKAIKEKEKALDKDSQDAKSFPVR